MFQRGPTQLRGFETVPVLTLRTGCSTSVLMADDFRTKVETLGDLKASGMGLYAHCTAPNAGHGSPLDLDVLIRGLGEDFVYIDDKSIGRAAVCKRCGHKGALHQGRLGQPLRKKGLATPVDFVSRPPAPGITLAKQHRFRQVTIREPYAH